MGGRVLLIDDDEEMCRLVDKSLSKAGYDVTTTNSGVEGRSLVESEVFDVLITDVNLPQTNGLELCEQVAVAHPQLPVVVITAFGSIDTAVAAIRVGAYDFITKPIDMKALELTVGRAVKHGKLKSEVRELRQAVEARGGLGRIVGESPPIRKMFDLIERIGDSETNILITGESGTGKELVARELHRRSKRNDEKFLAVNCAAMPATLLESELFGHVKGAFTDAKSSRDGLFVQADGGTLFLDEIGEMPLEMQPKLLRVLQENSVRPVGGNQEIPFNTRILAATNRDLETDVEQGDFREDLFYRINVVGVHVPPLRARGKDVLLLAQWFLEQFAERSDKPVVGISSGAAQKLIDYDWPGNVRELQNSMERAVTLTRHDELAVEDLPEKVRQYQSTQWVITGNNPEDFVTLAELEERYMHRVLKATDGNVTQAAKVLGINRRTMYRKMEKFKENDV